MKIAILVVMCLMLVTPAFAGTNPFIGPQGPQGDQGIQGIPGNDGTNGNDGINGIPGNDGKDGINGNDGKDGTDALCDRNDPYGPGIDVIVWQNENKNVALEVQAKYDIPNKETSGFLVAKVNLWEMLQKKAE